MWIVIQFQATKIPLLFLCSPLHYRQQGHPQPGTGDLLLGLQPQAAALVLLLTSVPSRLNYKAQLYCSQLCAFWASHQSSETNLPYVKWTSNSKCLSGALEL
jgi:hypothetical protein